MSDWRVKAVLASDVAFFNYVDSRFEKNSRHVYVWDLDKTYLDTNLSSLRELWRTAVEKAFQKRNIPGTRSLVMAIQQSWQEEHGATATLPIFFITASPPQMEKPIREKLKLDGLDPYGAFFKDNLRNLRPSKLWRLTHQIGYKVKALMMLRLRLHPEVKQVLWGDDSETDAIIYNLYSDLCARRFTNSETRELLRGLRVTPPEIDMIIAMQERAPHADPVEKIYINLAVDTDPEYYLKFGRRTVPTYDSFQVAVDMFQDHRLSAERVVQVGQDLMKNYGYSVDQLQVGLDDLVRRQILGAQAASEILPVLKQNQLITSEYETTMVPRAVTREEHGRVFELEGHHEPWVPEHIDYLHDYR